LRLLFALSLFLGHFSLLRPFCFYPFIDLFAMYGYVAWRIYANADLVSFDAQHGYRDVIAYYKGFAYSAC